MEIEYLRDTTITPLEISTLSQTIMARKVQSKALYLISEKSFYQAQKTDSCLITDSCAVFNAFQHLWLNEGRKRSIAQLVLALHTLEFIQLLSCAERCQIHQPLHTERCTSSPFRFNTKQTY